MKGGSMLKAGRGGFDAKKCVATLRSHGISMLFVIGGDGTQYAGHLLFEEAKKEGFQVSVVGVPKSIDNDVLFLDRTFGFESAVEAAASVIRNGYVEATSCDRACSIVKLMGRDAGFVAAHAALASNLVDLCLIPEVDVELSDVRVRACIASVHASVHSCYCSPAALQPCSPAALAQPCSPELCLITHLTDAMWSSVMSLPSSLHSSTGDRARGRDSGRQAPHGHRRR